MVTTQDGSHTLFSAQYNQHYHNVSDGAVNEALHKHVVPAFAFHKNKTHLRILDICFGLGYNTFATIYHIIQNGLNHTVQIYSPELDENLIKSLKVFEYPKEFECIKPLINELIDSKRYNSERFTIELFIGNAREYVQQLSNLDIVYQDAFSSEVNPELWTVEYFEDIFKACNETAIMTTYAVATPIRLSMYKAGFYISEHIPQKRKITLATKQYQDIFGKAIDMELKQQRNQEAQPLFDNP